MVAERRCDHPTQGDLGVEVESLERDLTDTKRSLAAEEALATKLVENCGDQPSKWEEGERNRRVKLLTIPMIDEMVTLPEREQGENDEKKAYCIKSFDQTEDEERVQNDTVEHIVDVPVTRLRVFIMDDSDEPIPEWLNFVKGVVDTEDIPLNVCRENLLQTKILRVIKKRYVTKYLEMPAEIAEQKDDYKMFHEQFGERLKLGIHEDSTVGVKTAEVLRFNTSKPGHEQFSFDGHVDHMKEGQNDISCITGESIGVVSSSFLENLHKKGHEVPYMADPVDEYAVHQFKEFGGKC